jgi:3-oxoacyl-[acyl-carrier-protein] synthase-3
MRASIRAISFYLPEHVVTNRALVEEYSDWSIEKIEAKTGISQRHIAGQDECSSDLAVSACRRLFESGACTPSEVEFLILCTQSPDYFLPTTACLVQDRLGIKSTAGAFDINLGCSGFVYGLSMAKGLIETDQVRNVLLVTAETYSKFIHPADRSVRTIFGDAAAATLIRGTEGSPRDSDLGPFHFGTDGGGARNLIVRGGGTRERSSMKVAASDLADGPALYMNGPEIFNFTLKRVPESVQAVLARASLKASDVDLFVFHQANQFMLEHLRNKLDIAPEKFVITMRNCGNTVSSTIPIALEQVRATGALRPGMRVLVSGFGVGYSWASALLRWC